ncbi:MAG: nucleotide exchange factor GrpE [Gammaproteobacteria bacterium]|nr:nucleotide exchange factor GrpE [Gammaproteobacteria bacterium]
MTQKKASKAKSKPESKDKESPSVEEHACTCASAHAGAKPCKHGAHAKADSKSAQDHQALQEQLELAQQKAEENWDLLLRARADLENLRKRSQRDIESAHKYGLEKIANELLAVRDSMELGLSVALESTDVKSLHEGAELTLKMLAQVMERFGIQQVNPEKQKFNPELHQAMTLQESAELEPNTVVTVIQKGYTLNDRLLRPALVTVSKAPAVSE